MTQNRNLADLAQNLNNIGAPSSDSVSTSTGAFTLLGGAGVSANVYANSVYASNFFYANGVAFVGGGGGSTTSYNPPTISTSPPSQPSPGQIWIDDSSGIQYEYINDLAFSGWVEFGPGLKGTTGPTGSTGPTGPTGPAGAAFANSAISTILVVSNTTASTTTTSGAFQVRGGVGIIGDAYVGGSINVTGGMSLSGTLGGTVISVSNNIGLTYYKIYNDVLTQTYTTTTTDIDITPYLASSTQSYNVLEISVFGQYVSDISNSASAQARLFKQFTQGVWVNNSGTWVLDGGTVTASNNTDATNFPAGAINAAKVTLVVGAGTAVLRLTNRTSPASTSITYWDWAIKNLRY